MSKRSQHPHEARARRDQFIDPAPDLRLSWNSIIIAVAALFLVAAVLIVGPRQGGADGPPLAARVAEGTDFAVDESALGDGQARFFQYSTAEGRLVRFFVMKSSDGVVRAALDACTTCYRERRGYRQEGDAMVCNNCGKAFASKDINVMTGGCNPIPLERSVQNGRVVVRAASLERTPAYF
jgi:uncharacterized membrane protein